MKQAKTWARTGGRELLGTVNWSFDESKVRQEEETW